jgi:hypothetical protein
VGLGHGPLELVGLGAHKPVGVDPFEVVQVDEDSVGFDS